mmetsp:Transcript_40413/g.101718  ORF Transcript_40413/g.101718 Transcript_40413/m.101718 type:complete len:212 (-) Transcript_40413:307-942(-)
MCVCVCVCVCACVCGCVCARARLGEVEVMGGWPWPFGGCLQLVSTRPQWLRRIRPKCHIRIPSRLAFLGGHDSRHHHNTHHNNQRRRRRAAHHQRNHVHGPPTAAAVAVVATVARGIATAIIALQRLAVLAREHSCRRPQGKLDGVVVTDLRRHCGAQLVGRVEVEDARASGRILQCLGDNKAIICTVRAASRCILPLVNQPLVAWLSNQV